MRIKFLKANRFQREWVGFFLDRQPTGCDSGNLCGKTIFA